jgi:Flp pilus assembly protein TadG
VAQTLNRRRHRSSRQRGAELVEFALVLPLVLVLVMGIFDFGLAFQRYEVITNAAREGARLGTLQQAYDGSDIQDRVHHYCRAAGLPTGCSGADVEFTSIVVGAATMPAVQVTVNYPYQFAFLGPAMRLIGGASFGTITLRASSTMRCEVACGD